ncbi:hypothetical protein [Limnohabitans sp. Rim8]|uniref:hypothetical protein n=1 Tax=Limnohabitans sp. Rim8 TaxID=1100718 RepID=UPI00345C53DF
MNTNEQIMAWMMDTYSMNEGATAADVVTEKPLTLGVPWVDAKQQGVVFSQ